MEDVFIPGEDLGTWRPQGQINASGQQIVNLGSDANLMVSFDTIQQVSKEVRDAAGRPKIYDTLIVRIKKPGDMCETVRPATASDKVRFKDAWYVYTTGSKAAGTPLDDWDFPNDYQKRLLKALGIFTVEQVAALTEIDRQKVGIDAQDLWQAANVFLDKKIKEGAESAQKQMFVALQGKNTELEAKLLANLEKTAELEKMISEATVEKVPAKSKGRPKKIVEQEVVSTLEG